MGSRVATSPSMFTEIVRCASSSTQSARLLNMNDLSPMPHKTRKRWGRGIGSGRGKQSGYGHQKSRSNPGVAFEGGQTPLYKRLPKIGFHNHGELSFQVLNVSKIQEFITMNRLTVPPNTLITMRNLVESGIVTGVKGGIKLLDGGSSVKLTHPIHLEVSNASRAAIDAVEAAGGTVTCVHFNKLALRFMLKPVKFSSLPRRARPPPRLMDLYLDGSKCGYLSPEVQQRNLKLFGAVTSEPRLRQEHEDYMAFKRKVLAHKSQYERSVSEAREQQRAGAGAGGSVN
jgi:large subunit ribosomal protein L15